MQRAVAGILLCVFFARTAQSQTIDGFGSGLIDRDYSRVGTQMLDAFEFQYVGSGNNLAAQVDHHLTQVLIAPEITPGKIRVGFHDKNHDDRYYYRIMYHRVMDPRIQRFTRTLDICGGGRCTAQLNKPAGDFVFVLVGFQLAFRGDDHHIDEIGILENNGQATVFYNDKNDDDSFVWSLQFAYVPRDLFRELGVSRGTRERTSARRTIAPGTSVIRGFRFNFEPYFTDGGDHHVRALRVRSPSGEVGVVFKDKNGDDGFDWEVHWGILR